MQLHNLKPNPKIQKKRIGRGGKRGTTATRGTKGAGSRSGGAKGPLFEGTKVPLFRRTPKLRGFKSIYAKKTPINLAVIEKHFQDNEVVDAKSLFLRGVIRNKQAEVKILGVGELSKKIIIDGCLVSKTAAEKIKKAGGEVKIMIENKI